MTDWHDPTVVWVPIAVELAEELAHEGGLLFDEGVRITLEYTGPRTAQLILDTNV